MKVTEQSATIQESQLQSGKNKATIQELERQLNGKSAAIQELEQQLEKTKLEPMAALESQLTAANIPLHQLMVRPDLDLVRDCQKIQKIRLLGREAKEEYYTQHEGGKQWEPAMRPSLIPNTFYDVIGWEEEYLLKLQEKGVKGFPVTGWTKQGVDKLSQRQKNCDRNWSLSDTSSTKA